MVLYAIANAQQDQAGDKAYDPKFMIDASNPTITLTTTLSLSLNITLTLNVPCKAMNTKEGMTKVVKYLKSVGRFGSSAFLASNYGLGELPQGFCRLCAVHGGIHLTRILT